MASVSKNTGWNSGAKSITSFAGDCIGTFKVQTPSAGVTCGLGRAAFTRTPSEVMFGFRFYSDANGDFAYPCEYGERVGSIVAFTSTDEFVVRRIGHIVTLLMNGSVIYTSTRKSGGVVHLVSTLYEAGDKVI